MIIAGEGDDSIVIDSNFSLAFTIDGALGTDVVEFRHLPMLDLAQLPNDSLQSIEEIRLGIGSQQLRLAEEEVVRITNARNTLSLRYSSDDTLHTTDSWKVAQPDFRAGEYVHRFIGERAILEIINDRPWQNPVLLHDVNRDQSTTALDALTIINRLGRQMMNELPAPGSASDVIYYYDTTGDGNVTAMDALRVINHLSRSSIDAVGGELASTAVSRASDFMSDDDERHQATDAALQEWTGLF